MRKAVLETDLEGLQLIRRGKVRDMYDLGDQLLMVASDRISAFDVVMSAPIPGKGIILNQISLFWFNAMADIVPNHVISDRIEEYPAACRKHSELLAGRSMLVRKTRPLSIECVVRGYITGSGWKSYQKGGTVCGIVLPPGLSESQKLPEPIFTPSTKEELGQHDINIDFDEACRRVGRDLAEQARDISIALYRKGSEMALEKGIIIADTKFEFGLLDGRLILIDEVLTPDSSRFWPLATYRPGASQESYDKQYLRDYLLSIKWNQQPPAPELPDEVVQRTREKYIDALRLLTGHTHGL